MCRLWNVRSYEIGMNKSFKLIFGYSIAPGDANFKDVWKDTWNYKLDIYEVRIALELTIRMLRQNRLKNME